MSTNAAAEEDRASEVVPAVPLRGGGGRVIYHGLLTVRFVYGTEGNVDMRELLRSDRVAGTLFEQLRDSSFFSRVTARLGAVEWPGEIDLAPDAMYDEIRAHGVWILN